MLPTAREKLKFFFIQKAHLPWILLAICALLFGAFLLISSEMTESIAGEKELIGAIDVSSFHFLAQFREPGLNEAAINITALGSGPVLFIVVLIVGLLCALNSKIQECVQLCLAALGSWGLMIAFKNHFERARPDEALRLVHVDGYSYPSGHSLASAAIYFTIAVIASHFYPRARAAMLTLFLLLILTIATSRIYLGVHYFSDVTGGIMLGLAWAFLLTGLGSKLNLYKGTRNVQ